MIIVSDLSDIISFIHARYALTAIEMPDYLKEIIGNTLFF